MVQWLLTLSIVLLVCLVKEVRTQATTGASAGRSNTYTSSPQHPFCVRPPVPATPKITIFSMDVKSGFQYGYRSNQSVIVEIRANFPQVWRIQQVYLQVPDNDPKVHRAQQVPGYRKPKTVGHWAWSWNLRGTQDPKIGHTEPLDCGGISTFGTFSMVSPYGAHAAKLMSKIRYPSDPNKGFESVVAKWVPPSNWENLMLRKTVTIEAYVTFEKTPPQAAVAPTHPGYSPTQKPQGRWVKLTATLLNLDLIDLHNYLRIRFPFMMDNILRLG